MVNQKLVLTVACDDYIWKIDYYNININEIVVRVMAVIGKIEEMRGEERKELAMEVVTYLLDRPELRISDTAKQLMKMSLPALIDMIYQLHKGELFQVIEWDHDIKEIQSHLINYFNFPVDKEMDYNDIFRVVSYVVTLMDSYEKWEKNQKKYISLKVIIKFIGRFIIRDNILSSQLIDNLMELVARVGDGKFTITGKHISMMKRCFAAIKCC